MNSRLMQCKSSVQDKSLMRIYTIPPPPPMIPNDLITLTRPSTTGPPATKSAPTSSISPRQRGPWSQSVMHPSSDPPKSAPRHQGSPYSSHPSCSSRALWPAGSSSSGPSPTRSSAVPRPWCHPKPHYSSRSSRTWSPIGRPCTATRPLGRRRAIRV